MQLMRLREMLASSSKVAPAIPAIPAPITNSRQIEISHRQQTHLLDPALAFTTIPTCRAKPLEHGQDTKRR